MKKAPSKHYEVIESINHECGLAMVRLLKPLSYYQKKYSDSAWGLHKLCLLLEKQRNRGQDSVGLVAMQSDMPAGFPFMKRLRTTGNNAIEKLFEQIYHRLSNDIEYQQSNDSDIEIKKNCRLIGETYLGHLRYATHGGDEIDRAQPYIYESSIAAKHIALAGNFNMTNCPAILKHLISHGLSPSSTADMQLIVNHISYCLDKAYEKACALAREHVSSTHEAIKLANTHLDITSVLRDAARHWDGGYVFAGIVGNGDTFICRDPAGIRPGFYYINDEFFAAASERSALMNGFGLQPEKIRPIPRGHILIVKKDGALQERQFTNQIPEKQCAFERIYFSRPSDPSIYQERKTLGTNLAQRTFNALNKSVENTIFSYIPNSSEIPFHGLVEKLDQLVMQHTYNKLTDSGVECLSEQDIFNVTHTKTRVEKLIFKDQVIRTFIANDSIRSDLVSKVYDVTRGVVSDQDTLVALDDSIVRGTTLQKSIIKQLITLNPKRIVILSAAPPILYPDCYGIDMSQIGRLIGFQAAIELTRERGNQAIIDELYKKCLTLKKSNAISFTNPIKKLYSQFTQQELEEKIAHLIYPYDSSWSNPLTVMYQTIEGMRHALPHHKGDWYFTGNYPTLGGYKVAINSFINWYTNKSGRAY